MTSKEALNNMQYMLERTDNLVFYKEEIEAIKNDLEVLTILKKYLGYHDYGYAEFVLRLEEDSDWLNNKQREQLKKDFNKVKEWWNDN